MPVSFLAVGLVVAVAYTIVKWVSGLDGYQRTLLIWNLEVPIGTRCSKD